MGADPDGSGQAWKFSTINKHQQANETGLFKIYREFMWLACGLLTSFRDLPLVGRKVKPLKSSTKFSKAIVAHWQHLNKIEIIYTRGNV